MSTGGKRRQWPEDPLVFSLGSRPPTAASYLARSLQRGGSHPGCRRLRGDGGSTHCPPATGTEAGGGTTLKSRSDSGSHGGSGPRVSGKRLVSQTPKVSLKSRDLPQTSMCVPFWPSLEGFQFQPAEVSCLPDCPPQMGTQQHSLRAPTCMKSRAL